MQTHATRSPRGLAVPGATTVAASSGGPTPIPETAAADRTSRQAARADAASPIHPSASAHQLPRALPDPCLARGTSPGRLPHGAAGGLSLTTVRFVRTFVFRMSQEEFAALLGTSQGRVSTWESTGRWPSMVVMDLARMHGKRICAERGEVWSDSWFFEVPVSTAALMVAE